LKYDTARRLSLLIGILNGYSDLAVAGLAPFFLQIIPSRIVIPSENENRENEHGDA
jgi:hypothetical protein